MSRDFDPHDLNRLLPSEPSPDLPPLDDGLLLLEDPRSFARRVLSTRLGEESAWYLSAALDQVDLEPGEALFRYGEPGPGLYLLCAGRLEVSLPVVSPPLVLAEVSPGKWLGEVHLIDGGPSSATVIATTPALLLGLDVEGFARIREEEPGVAADLLRAVLADLAARVKRNSRGVVTSARDGSLGLSPGAPDPVEILVEAWQETA